MNVIRISALALLMSATGVMAQTSSEKNNAVNVKPASEANSVTATQGANSFTEAQAKDRIAKAGYSSVEALTKMPDGIWSGKATRNGQSVTVMLDYKGNVSQQ